MTMESDSPPIESLSIFPWCLEKEVSAIDGRWGWHHGTRRDKTHVTLKVSGTSREDRIVQPVQRRR